MTVNVTEQDILEYRKRVEETWDDRILYILSRKNEIWLEDRFSLSRSVSNDREREIAAEAKAKFPWPKFMPNI